MVRATSQAKPFSDRSCPKTSIGVFYVGLGDQFDGDKVQAYPPGSVIFCPAIRLTSTGQSPVSMSPR
jgi:hypothetical protein